MINLERMQLETTLAPQDLPACGRVLLDVLREDVSFSIRDDEAEESWRIVREDGESRQGAPEQPE